MNAFRCLPTQETANIERSTDDSGATCRTLAGAQICRRSRGGGGGGGGCHLMSSCSLAYCFAWMVSFSRTVFWNVS